MVECFRRVALTGLAVFIYPDSSAQLAIVLLLATFFMVLSEVLSPFARSLEMWLYRAGHYVIFASMYLALLLRVDVSNERAQSQEVGACVCGCVMCVGAFFFALPRGGERGRGKGGAGGTRLFAFVASWAFPSC